MKHFYAKQIFLFIIGVMLCGAITAQTSYGIRIAGTDLTSANVGAIDSSNFPNLILNEGTITYDHSAKLFTLDGVNANVTNGNFIYITEVADVAEYKINLVGNNVINTSDASIRIYRNLIIEGNGSLKVIARIGYGFYVLSALDIKNTTVEATGGRGIAGFEGVYGETLRIENSTVKASGPDGSICDLENITLIDCEITQPEGAAVGANGSNGQAVMIGGYVISSEVVIEPITGIANTDAQVAFSIYPNPAGNILNIVSENVNETIIITDLSGKTVHVEQANLKQSSINISHLPEGIYIIKIGCKTAKFVKDK